MVFERTSPFKYTLPQAVAAISGDLWLIYYIVTCFSGTLDFDNIGIILIYYVPFSPIIISVFLLFYRLENLSIGHP